MGTNCQRCFQTASVPSPIARTGTAATHFHRPAQACASTAINAGLRFECTEPMPKGTILPALRATPISFHWIETPDSPGFPYRCNQPSEFRERSGSSRQKSEIRDRRSDHPLQSPLWPPSVIGHWSLVIAPPLHHSTTPSLHHSITPTALP